MTDKKDAPIILLMPITYKDREFEVAFDKHIDEIKNCFVMDMNHFQIKPKTGAEVFADEGYKLFTRRIGR